MRATRTAISPRFAMSRVRWDGGAGRASATAESDERDTRTRDRRGRGQPAVGNPPLDRPHRDAELVGHLPRREVLGHCRDCRRVRCRASSVAASRRTPPDPPAPPATCAAARYAGRRGASPFRSQGRQLANERLGRAGRGRAAGAQLVEQLVHALVECRLVAATTSWTSPIARARSASKRWPVTNRARACDSPIFGSTNG